MGEAKLPVHGFVLAGGKSSRMGRDKALLEFHKRPMVEIAVAKLRTFCAQVSIAGNRDDLAGFAPVVRETRVEAGPAAGIEAALAVCEQDWAMFMPVDVPLVPAELLKCWAQALPQKAAAGCGCSYLVVNRERQPAFCAVRSAAFPSVARALHAGERSIAALLAAIDNDDAGWLWHANAAHFAPGAVASEFELNVWFSNVNTEQELEETESWAVGMGCGLTLEPAEPKHR